MNKQLIIIICDTIIIHIDKYLHCYYTCIQANTSTHEKGKQITNNPGLFFNHWFNLCVNYLRYLIV